MDARGFRWYCTSLNRVPLILSRMMDVIIKFCSSVPTFSFVGSTISHRLFKMRYDFIICCQRLYPAADFSPGILDILNKSFFSGCPSCFSVSWFAFARVFGIFVSFCPLEFSQGTVDFFLFFLMQLVEGHSPVRCLLDTSFRSLKSVKMSFLVCPLLDSSFRLLTW